jgi:hypothetical protein
METPMISPASLMPWADLALLIERQLLAKKQILGNQRSSSTETRASETQSIDRQVARNAKHKEKQSGKFHPDH